VPKQHTDEHKQAHDEQMSEHGLETHVTAQDQEIQKCAFYQQYGVDVVLRF
jgi:hypothetical protein